MKDIKLRLEYGEPLIGKIALENGALNIEVVIPGVTDGSMVLVADDSSLMIEHEVDSKFIEKFKVFVISEKVDFYGTLAKKEDGVLFITCPCKEETKVGKVTITL